jgi:AAA domain/DnaB-like helicase N terminal domain
VKKARLLPHNDELERCILGLALMAERHATVVVESQITTADFYSPSNATLFSVMHARIQLGKPMSVIEIEQTLALLNWRVPPGDESIAGFLYGLMAGVPDQNIEEHCASLIQLSYQRQVIQQAEMLMESAYVSHDLTQPLQQMESLFEISPSRQANTFLPIPLGSYFEGSEFNAPEQPIGMLGKRTDGIKFVLPGAKGLLIAPPESGKSFFCIALAVEAARNGQSVIYIDFESNADKVAKRVVSHRHGLHCEKLFHYIRPRQAWTKLTQRGMDAMIDDIEPTLIILDGYNSFFAQNDVNTFNPNEINQMIERSINPLMRSNVCILIVDHVSKGDTGSTRSKTATGSVAKTGDADYALTFEPVVGQSFRRGTMGYATISVVKDRDGALRHHTDSEHQIAIMAVDSTHDGYWSHAFTPPGNHEYSAEQ